MERQGREGSLVRAWSGTRVRSQPPQGQESMTICPHVHNQISKYFLHIHSCKKHVLGMHYVPDSILGIGNRARNKIDKIIFFIELIF